MTNPLGMFDYIGRAGDITGDFDETERDRENSIGCVIMLLLASMLFCGLAIVGTDESEPIRIGARTTHYETCNLCW